MSGEDWQVWTPGRYQLAEGARWYDGRLTFVDLLQGTLNVCHPARPAVPRRALDLGVPLGAVAPVAGRAGEWLVAAGTGIARVGGDGRPDWLARPEQDAGQPMRMNDAACDPAGRFWATSMASTAAPGAGSLYRVDTDGTVHRVLGDLTIPNGPAFDPAGRILYLADSARSAITRYPLDPATGALGAGRLFATVAPGDGRPDGMTVDDRGFLWVAMWGAGRIHCYAPDGRLSTTVTVPTPHVSSIAFGGGRMFVTTALHRLALPDPLAGAVLVRRCRTTAPPVAPYGSSGG